MAHEKFISRIQYAINKMKKDNPKGGIEVYHTSREKRAYIDGFNFALYVALRIIESENIQQREIKGEFNG